MGMLTTVKPKPLAGRESVNRAPLSLHRITDRQRLSDYRYDETLARFELVMTVKHQKQRALNRIMRGRLDDPGHLRRLGGRSIRRYRDGLLVRHSPQCGRTQHMPMQEPFGMSRHGLRLAVAAGNQVRVYDAERGVVDVYVNPWFGQLHSVHFSADGRRLLVASTGFDSVLEFDPARCELTWAWNAWGHGYSTTPDGVPIRFDPNGRDPATGSGCILVGDPQRWHGFGLPTGLTATHLNNASYRSDNAILVTLFHQGRGIAIDRESGAVKPILSGLLNPHGFESGNNGECVITDTRRGQVLFFDADMHARGVLVVDACDPPRTRQGLGEWLQNVLHLRDGIYAAIDIHRSSLWLIDPLGRRYRRIALNQDWAVQNVMALARGGVSRKRQRLHEFAEVFHHVCDRHALIERAMRGWGRAASSGDGGRRA